MSSNSSKIPPASFPMLISALAGQAAVALGQMENPISKKKELNLELAKHMVDTLDMLTEKTKGNLSQEESSMLAMVLHELRMAYVAAKK